MKTKPTLSMRPPLVIRSKHFAKEIVSIFSLLIVMQAWTCMAAPLRKVAAILPENTGSMLLKHPYDDRPKLAQFCKLCHPINE